MADEKTLTQADVDAAVKKAVDKAQSGIEATVQTAVAAALANFNTVSVAAAREQQAADEEAARTATKERIRAKNKKANLYSSPECEILIDCKVANNFVYAGDRIGQNAGVTEVHIDDLIALKMAKAV